MTNETPLALRLANARIALLAARDAERIARALAEFGAIQAAGGEYGKNEADRARFLTIALSENQAYQEDFADLRKAEADVLSLEAEHDIAFVPQVLASRAGITEIKASYAAVINLGNYENVRLEATATRLIDEDEMPIDVHAELFAFVRREIEAEAALVNPPRQSRFSALPPPATRPTETEVPF